MRVLFYTYYMLPGTERLMPWRTLIEVTRWMNATGKYEASICSAQLPEETRQYEGLTIYSIDPSPKALRTFVSGGGWDVVFYPVTYRQGLRNMNFLADLHTEVIAYIPGGVYPIGGSFRLIFDGHMRIAKPYLLDSLTPHRLLAHRLHKAYVNKIICQTPFTAINAEKHGWKSGNVFCAIPGKDTDDILDDSLVIQLGLNNQRFLMFSGAPSPVRGAVKALHAFDKVAPSIPDYKLVLLMRRDINSDFHEIEAASKSIRNTEQIIIYQEKASRAQLFGMFKAARAVLLPFIIVPSEIPLTFFEVMSYGTPIITYENGGTTDYLMDGLKIARKRNEKSLGKAIIGICHNQDEYALVSQKAKELMKKHPTWEQTAEIWAEAITRLNV